MKQTILSRLTPLWNLSCRLPALCLILSAFNLPAFTYTDFSSTNGLNLTGVAASVGGALRLTPEAESVVGTAWAAAKQPCAAGFDTSFQFRITNPGSMPGTPPGSDGFLFTLQKIGPTDPNVHPNTAPADGSVSVFFNTFWNWPDSTDFTIWDVSGNSVGVVSNGLYLAQTDLNPRGVNLKDGAVHNARITFDGTGLTVSLDGVMVLTNVPVPGMASAVDAEGKAWVGFGSFTGWAWENHDILSWSFSPTETSPTLLNVNFAAYSQVKVGFAGTGQTSSDFWNNYTAPFQAFAWLSNLTMADGTPTTVGLTVQNGAGHWSFAHPDLMYNTFCYSQDNGDITLMVTNLPSGEFDFYLYGHSGAANGNTVFQLLAGCRELWEPTPQRQMPIRLSTNWVEGAQYVVYRNVAVTNGGAPVTIKAHPGLSGYALLNGMQIAASPARAPFITVQPADQIIPAGSAASFSVTANGSLPLNYQWRKGGLALPGGTDPTLLLPNTTTSDSGAYDVVVANTFGAVTSQVATLTVRVQTSPTLLNVNFAAYSQVKVGFAGTGQTSSDFWNNYTAPFQAFAWLSNLTMADGTPTTVGLTVQNGAGHWNFAHPDLMYNTFCYSQNHGDITLTVTNLPSGEYDFYLYGHEGAARGNTVFQLLIGGADYGNRSTATNSDWALTNFVEGAQYVVFRGVAVTNGGAPVTIKAHPGLAGDALLNGMQIASATVVAGTPPSIVTQPQSQTADVGSAVTFTVTAGGTAPLSYQWRLGGANLAGATGSALVLVNVQVTNAGNYSVDVTNASGSITSSNALLTVISPCVPAPTNLVSWWRAEGNAWDQMGGNNGVLLNGTGFDTGVVGQAFRFTSSSNSYVEVADSPTLRLTNALTIECWAKRLNTSEVHMLVAKGGTWNGGQADYHIGLNDTYAGGKHFGFGFGGGWRGCVVTPDTAWHHYAAVAVSGQADPILYIDGVPQTITLRGGPATMTLSATTRPLRIGALVDTQTGWLLYSSTLIDEPAVFNRALAASEIQAIYTAGSSGMCPAGVAPSIITQPASQTVLAGSAVSFTATAQGTPPLSLPMAFEWNQYCRGDQHLAHVEQCAARPSRQLHDAGDQRVWLDPQLQRAADDHQSTRALHRSAVGSGGMVAGRRQRPGSGCRQ